MTNPAKGNLMRALIMCALGMTLVSSMDGVIKYLSKTEHSLMVTLGRYVFGLMFAAVIWFKAGRPAINGDMWRAHGARGVVMAACSVSFIWSLSVLPLVTAILISFIAPLMVPFIAAIFLKERLRPTSVITCGLGFVGAVIAVLGPTQSAIAIEPKLYFWGCVGAFFGAICYAITIVLLRRRAEKDGSAIVGLLAALIPLALIAGPSIAIAPAPSPQSLPAFLLLGFFAATGIWALSEGYRIAQAQQLVFMEFTCLIWAALIGFVFFDETPSLQMWVGAAVIVAACVWNGWFETQEPKGAG
jgi:S-adenosylmethionine uptake transporter